MFVTKEKYDELKKENETQRDLLQIQETGAEVQRGVIYELQASNRKRQARLDLWEGSGLKLPKMNQIDTQKKKKACIDHIQKYLDRIAFMEGNNGENARRIPEQGPEKNCHLCETFDYKHGNEHACIKCPLGPKYRACMTTPDFMMDFNVRQKETVTDHSGYYGHGRKEIIRRYPNVAKLRRRMGLLMKQFKECGLDIDINTPKRKASEKVSLNMLKAPFDIETYEAVQRVWLRHRH